VTAISDAMAPLAIEAQDQEAAVHIEVRGGAGSPTFASSSTVAECATWMRTTMLVMTSRSPDGLANTQDSDLRALRISDKRYAVPDLKRSSGRGKQRCRISNTA
jgi:hypothetical protein